MNINYKSVLVPGILFILFFSSVSTLYSANVSVEVQENIDSLVMTNSCVDCNLTGADLNRLNLSGADLHGADLSNATFFLADLSDANLSGAILRGTQFGGADLAGADLRKADLRGVKMAGAYLVGSRFDGSFSEVNVSDDSSGLETLEKTYIPDDSVPKKAPEKQQVNIAERRDFGPVPPQLNPSAGSATEMKSDSPVDTSAPAKKTVSPPENIVVQNENIEPADENNKQDLIKDQFPQKQEVQTESNSTKSKTEKSDLVELSETDIVASQKAKDLPAGDSDKKVKNLPLKEEIAVDRYKEATVTAEPHDSEAEESMGDKDEKVVESDIVVSSETKNAVVERSDEKEENLSVKEEMAVDSNKEATVTIVEETKEVSLEVLNQQKQLKKYKKCYNCNLAGSDFSGENLDSADLEGSDFTGANLEKVDFEDANLKGVSFKNAILKNAKFNGADLYKADFTGADLTGAEFKKALIDETNFQGATGYDSLMLNQPQ